MVMANASSQIPYWEKTLKKLSARYYHPYKWYFCIREPTERYYCFKRLWLYKRNNLLFIVFWLALTDIVYLDSTHYGMECEEIDFKRLQIYVESIVVLLGCFY